MPRSTQQTIPFETIFPDGICKIKKGYYSRTIEFQDMNYQIARQDDKISIFEDYCGFLNYFDSSIDFQVSLINEFIDRDDLEKKILIPLNSEDSLDQYRQEYNDMLISQIEKGNNSIQKSRYLTFSISAKSDELARQMLNRIEVDVLNNFKNVGCSARTLNGYERLDMLYNLYNQNETYKFNFDYKYIPIQGLSVKDFIAPQSFNFKAADQFYMGKTLGRVSYLRINAPELSDAFLSELANLSSNMVISMNMRSVKQDQAQKRVKRQLAMMESNKITEQRKAVKQGFDMDLIPSELKHFISEAENMLNELQQRNERMFQITFLILNTGLEQEDIDNAFLHIQGVAEKFNCQIHPLMEQQEDGLASVLPIGINKIEIKRTLTTSSSAIFVPFTTQELFQNNGMYYGLNGQSLNLIMINRKSLKNANGIILGSSGSGKSFAAKREMISTFFYTDDDIIVLDPDREYGGLAKAFWGEIVHISPSSKSYLNPMDMSEDYALDGEDPILMKSEFILSLFESLFGGKEGLKPIEKTIIDRCVNKVYRKYLANPKKNATPTLKDFYDTLKSQQEPEAEDIATALELYVTGSLKVFANQTNVNIKNRFVVYDIKDLGKQLQTMGLLIVLDQIWNRVSENKSKGKNTWIYIDEFHVLLKTEFTASYFQNLYKRIRKYKGIPTGITQNVEDVLRSEEGRGILSNSEFIQMLSQAPADRAELAKLLNISNQQLSSITNAEEGHGLLFCSGAIVPFIDKFPKDTQLYQKMSTKMTEIPNKGEEKTTEKKQKVQIA